MAQRSFLRPAAHRFDRIGAPLVGSRTLPDRGAIPDRIDSAGRSPCRSNQERSDVALLCIERAVMGWSMAFSPPFSRRDAVCDRCFRRRRHKESFAAARRHPGIPLRHLRPFTSVSPSVVARRGRLVSSPRRRSLFLFDSALGWRRRGSGTIWRMGESDPFSDCYFQRGLLVFGY